MNQAPIATRAKPKFIAATLAFLSTPPALGVYVVVIVGASVGESVTVGDAVTSEVIETVGAG